MATASIRFMLSVPAEMAEKVDELKRTVFYNRPYAEMFRYLIQLGLDNVQKSKCDRAS